jgi:serine/threonine protein kinase
LAGNILFCNRHDHELLESLNGPNPEILDGLADIVHKCIEKAPQNRCLSASAIAEDLYALNADRHA